MFKKIVNAIHLNKNAFKYGLISNTAIGVLLRGVGDAIQQTIEVKSNKISDGKIESKKKQAFDWTRTSTYPNMCYMKQKI